MNMKKILKFSIAAVAVVLLTTVLVSATVAAVAEEKVEFESTSMPALNCSMALSQAHGIFNLMPNEIKSVCRNEFVKVSARCAQNSEFTYQGVRVKTRAHEGLVDLTFTYASNTVKVKNASWESLGLFFNE